MYGFDPDELLNFKRSMQAPPVNAAQGALSRDGSSYAPWAQRNGLGPMQAGGPGGMPGGFRGAQEAGAPIPAPNPAFRPPSGPGMLGNEQDGPGINYSGPPSARSGNPIAGIGNPHGPGGYRGAQEYGGPAGPGAGTPPVRQSEPPPSPFAGLTGNDIAGAARNGIRAGTANRNMPAPAAGNPAAANAAATQRQTAGFQAGMQGLMGSVRPGVDEVASGPISPFGPSSDRRKR